MRTFYGDSILDHISVCQTCRTTWTSSVPAVCLWCAGEFCSDRCHDDHMPCEEYPGLCPECKSDTGLEPLDGTGWRCCDCGYVVDEMAGPDSPGIRRGDPLQADSSQARQSGCEPPVRRGSGQTTERGGGQDSAHGEPESGRGLVPAPPEEAS